MSPDGADTFGYLYNCFRDTKGNPPNYCKVFSTLSGNKPKNPVIILFDNEAMTDRPLRKFLKGIKISEQKSQELKDNSFCCLIERSNLFVLTLPIPAGEIECEIEDLFDIKVQSQVIDGRTFDRKVEKGDERHYGKEVFSQYVYSHYEEIDFSRFKPLFDSLERIITSYRD